MRPLRPNDLVDLLFRQFGQHTKPDTDAQREFLRHPGKPAIRARPGEDPSRLHGSNLFDTIYRRWMFNSAFPQPGAGNDALAERGLITVRKGAVFFMPPYTGRETGFIGSGLFKPAEPPKTVTEGRLVIRKKANDPAVNLAGISFQLMKTDGATAVGSPFVTDAAGRAKSEKVPIGDYLLQEVAPANFQPNPPLPVTLSKGSTGLVIQNTVVQPGVYG